jgi:GT2 family glycosyltransferase
LSGPEIAVVVPAHGRPLRLRWLLNALQEQSLERSRFEVLIAAEQPGLLELAAAHPLGALAIPAPGSGPAARRNAAWRAARAPLVAFTDDDCRPPADWLAQLLAAAGEHPGAVVQGTTRPDPDEAALRHRSPHARTQEVVPPTPFGQTCNIAYPREVLERLDGFDEDFPLAAGEDTDLLLRARADGRALVAAPGAVTFHAVEAASLGQAIVGAWRWRDLPLAVARHPGLRRHLVAGLFWKPAHARLCLALAGMAVARRRPLLGAALAAPWLAGGAGRYGGSPRGVARALAELPRHTLVDGAEVAAMVRGSIRHGTLVL